MDFHEAVEAGSVTTEQAFAIFDGLKPVDAGFLMGTWSGSEFLTGHPMDGSLAGSGWYGKRFSGLDDADPLLFYTADRSGFFVADPIGVAMALARGVADLSTVRDEIEKPASAARLRPIEHRGSVSMAMVYDAIPAIDHFRKVDDCTVLGIMDRRNDPGTYFFVLKRDA